MVEEKERLCSPPIEDSPKVLPGKMEGLMGPQPLPRPVVIGTPKPMIQEQDLKKSVIEFKGQTYQKV